MNANAQHLKIVREGPGIMEAARAKGWLSAAPQSTPARKTARQMALRKVSALPVHQPPAPHRGAVIGWGIVKLCGGREFLGQIAEAEIAGATFLCIAAMNGDGSFTPVLFPREQIKEEIVSITLLDEEQVRLAAEFGPDNIVHIQRTVSLYFNLPIESMTGKARPERVARVRQIAMWLARKTTSLSLSEIGQAFGGRDHGTVLHAVRRIDDLKETDAEIAHAVLILRRQIGV